MAQGLVKKGEDCYSSFMGLEILQEARVFNNPQLDPKRCSQVITRLLHILNQGETLTQVEATKVIFYVTKLFQSTDTGLRRMVYLLIKELSPSADEVIVVRNTLIKDMNSCTGMYRAHAIHLLCRTADKALLTQVEKYLKQAIADKNPVVASAALVSGIHLLQIYPEIVKKWCYEVHEAVQSRAALVQLHALALFHQIRQDDRMAVSKWLSILNEGSVCSPLAQCFMIRYISQVIRESGASTQTGDPPFRNYLEGCLHHKAEMVIFEAARAIIELSNVTTRELTSATAVLQPFLSSSKPVLKFAAERILNKHAKLHQHSSPTSEMDANKKLLSAIPGFARYGKLFKSSAPMELTHASTEYAVHVVKHIFDGHVVFQYNCKNTMPEHLLEDVTVAVDNAEAGEFSQLLNKGLRSLPYDTLSETFVAFKKPEGIPAVGKFSNVLKFTVKEIDPSTGEAKDDGLEDELQLEDFEVVGADYILKVWFSNFKNAWESMDPDGERIAAYELGPRVSLAEAVNAVIDFLGMQPCEGTELVPSNLRSHTCLLSGVYLGNVKVLVRLSFRIYGTNLVGKNMVSMDLAVRSEDVKVSDAIHEIVILW